MKSARLSLECLEDRTAPAVVAPYVLADPADLAIIKSARPDPVAPGQNITHTIVVVNNGPDAAQFVTISDLISPDLTFISGTATQGGPVEEIAPSVVRVNVLSIAPGATVTMTIISRVNPNLPNGYTLNNTATVISGTPDPDMNNNVDTARTRVQPSADLAITKTENPNPVAPGGILVYTLTVTNLGVNDAEFVSASDNLPAGTIFLFGTASQGTVTKLSPGSIIAEFGTIPAGSSATAIIVVTVRDNVQVGTVLANIADTGSETFDPDFSNNIDIAFTRVAEIVVPPEVIEVKPPDKPTFEFTGALSEFAKATTALNVLSIQPFPSTSTMTFQSQVGFFPLSGGGGSSGSGNDVDLIWQSKEAVKVIVHKFYDHNANGEEDEEDEGLSGWSILADGILMGRTGVNGNLGFYVKPGVYTITEVQKPRWLQTNGYSYTIVAAKGTVTEDVNGKPLHFGNVKMTRLLPADKEHPNAIVYVGPGSSIYDSTLYARLQEKGLVSTRGFVRMKDLLIVADEVLADVQIPPALRNAIRSMINTLQVVSDR